MNVREVGSFIRSQRTNAKMSLRQFSSLVGVSLPYLSQIERGLRRPGADILQAIAKGLRISAETLYVKAGILEDRPAQDVTGAILADQSITERQRQALVQIYEAFRQESAAEAAAAAAPARAASPKAASRRRAAAAKAAGKAPGKATADRRRHTGNARKAPAPKTSRPGGRAKSPAEPQPHPAPLRPSATQSPKKEEV